MADLAKEVMAALQDISLALEPVVAGSRDTRLPRLYLDKAKQMVREGGPWAKHKAAADLVLHDHD